MNRERRRSAARCLAFVLAANLFYASVIAWVAEPTLPPRPTESTESTEATVRAGDSFRTAYERTVRGYADVEWHVGLVEEGYQRLDAGGMPPGFWQWPQRNWAFFPLTPLLARSVSALSGGTASTFAVLWWLSQASLLALLLLFGEWARSTLAQPAGQRTAWVLLVGFVLPPVAFTINFVVLPMLLFGFALYALGRTLHDDEPRFWPWVAAAACLLAGLCRAQGLVLNFAILGLLAVHVAWLRRSPDRNVLLLAVANLVPSVMVMGVFFHRAGDPLAFVKIQAAWGRSLSAPWTPWLEYLRSGQLVDLHHDDLVFTGLRCLLFAAFALAAARRVLRDDLAATEVREGLARCTERSPYRVWALWLIALALVFTLLPSMSGTLLSAHRYASFAFPGVALWLSRGGVLPPAALCALIALRAVELGLFFRGWHVFIW